MRSSPLKSSRPPTDSQHPSGRSEYIFALLDLTIADYVSEFFSPHRLLVGSKLQIYLGVPEVLVTIIK